MQELFNKSKPVTSETPPGSTHSAELQGGKQPSTSPHSRQTEMFGRPAFPASPGQTQEKKQAAAMTAICGQNTSGSSKSADLSLFLASRCKQRLEWVGSMEYSQTWKRKATPAGRLYWEHTARGRRTFDSDFFGWPSPTAHDGRRPGADLKSTQGGNLNRDSHQAGWPTPNTPSGGRSTSIERQDATGKKHTASLEHAVKFSGWPTCRAEDSEQTGAHRGIPDTLNSASKLAGWGTPRQTDAKCGRFYTENTTGTDLAKDATLAGYVTPGSRDWKDTPGMATMGTNPDGTERKRLDQLPRQVANAFGTPPGGTTALTKNTGGYLLNPAFSLWLMMGSPMAEQWFQAAQRAVQASTRSRKGWPAGAECFAGLATPSSPPSPPSSSEPTSTP